MVEEVQRQAASEPIDNVIAFGPLLARQRPAPLSDEEILRFRSMLIRFERVADAMDRLRAEDGCPVARQLLGGAIPGT